jgi:hypothetical protein
MSLTTVLEATLQMLVYLRCWSSKEILQTSIALWTVHLSDKYSAMNSAFLNPRGLKFPEFRQPAPLSCRIYCVLPIGHNRGQTRVLYSPNFPWEREWFSQQGFMWAAYKRVRGIYTHLCFEWLNDVVINTTLSLDLLPHTDQNFQFGLQFAFNWCLYCLFSIMKIHQYHNPWNHYNSKYRNYIYATIFIGKLLVAQLV